MRVMQRGFSLIELLLTVALLALITAVSLPQYNNFLVSRLSVSDANQLVTQLHKARMYAIQQKEGGGWGVYVQASSSVLYQGTDYAGRNVAYDEINQFGSLISDGPHDVVFSSTTGRSSINHTINFTDTIGTDRVMTINRLGVVEL